MLSIARSISLFLLPTITLSLVASLPELSSIEPLEFDEGAQRLVARGDARLDFDGTRLQADRITYYQEFGLADALGNVILAREGYRAIADRASYDTQENLFSVNILRTGQWPYYVSAVSGGGQLEASSLLGGTVYLGDPGRSAPNVSANQIEYTAGTDTQGDSVRLTGATFRIGNFPFFYWPGYTYYLNNPPYHLSLAAGYDDELGAYTQTTVLVPVSNWLRAGVNFDLYSKRGFLAGPAAQYVYNSETQTVFGAFSSGYIKDQGDTEEDIFDRPIDSSRGFAEWRHKHHIGERVSLTAAAHYWSDSDVTRDFRENSFDDNQRPDTFVEGVYAGDNYFVSAFGRFRPNNHQLIQERLPELRFDHLPVPVFETGAYHRFSVSYARLREDFGRFEPAIKQDNESDRLDATYRIERPIPLNDWLTLTPLAGARFTHYSNQQTDPILLSTGALPPGTFDRSMYELGFDLEARAYAQYDTQNATWGINGLRHLVRPVLRYRYFSDPDAVDEIAAVDRASFDLARPLLDLSDLRNIDSITETHLARLGVENLFQTRAKGYGSRTLAALNFYQDILFEKNQHFDGGEQETLHATWLELRLHPAPWLKFDLASRFKTDSLTLEELRTRTAILSGEIWELGLATYLLKDKIDQYSLDFIYRFNERYAVLTDVRFDAERGDLTRTSLGLITRIGTTWEIVYALTFRKDARRESDLEFNVRVRLADL